jgi:DNA-binding NarL/FixJ family response regulator
MNATTAWVQAAGAVAQKPGRRRAVLVDQHPLWLLALGQTLASASVDVVGTAGTLVAARRLIEELRPDLVIVEGAMREGETTGLAWLAEINERFQGIKLIVLSASDDLADVNAALNSGAAAYVVKTANPYDLTVAVRQVYEPSIYLFRKWQNGRRTIPQPSSNANAGLTRREVEILELAAEGLSNDQIAKQFWVTVQTVKFHLSNIYRKLGVSNRTTAARQAQLRGLLPEPGPELRQENGANLPAAARYSP